MRKVRALDSDTYKVHAESTLFETRLDFLEAFRLEDASYYKVLEKLVPYTRFVAGDYGFGGVNQATAWITRKSVLQAIRKLEELYAVEFYVDIEVDEERQCVSERKLCFCAEQGAWRGLRLVRNKNLDSGELIVKADEVVTALYGFGSSFGAYDEDRNPTGGFTRRLTFGSVNGGVDYVEDERAKERYGRLDATGERMNNYGHVIFDDIEKPGTLHLRTHQELQKLTLPKVGYVIADELDMSERHVGLGDVAMVVDEVDGETYRCGMRATRRVRRFGDGFMQKVRFGEITAGTRSHFAAYERKCSEVASFDDALIKAGLKEPDVVEVPDTALSMQLKLRSAKRADGEDIDLRYDFDLRVDDVYRYDVSVRNNLACSVGSVSVSVPVADLSEENVYIGAGSEKLYSFALSPDAQQIAAGAITCVAQVSCPGGNIGLALEYASCSLSASHTLPLTSIPKPIDDIPDDLTGDGTFENPYTVADLRRCVCVSTNEAAFEDVWLSGYIVGWADMDANNGLSADTLRLGANDATASNIVLADAPNATSVNGMCAVNLSTATKRRKAERTALNLEDNPGMLGVRVWVQGDVLRYGRETGMKRTDEYRFCDASGQWHGWWTANGQLGETLKG